tara:strand:+ start:319 stop:771 length:453 start_codon:yes stop_codon:yes gene_type:complete
MDKDLLYKWIAIITCTIFAFFVIQMFNLWNALYKADQTKLSFLILTIWSIASGCILYKIFKPNRIYDELLWFTAESMITVGLIGTVSGFLLMLYSSFEGIDVTSTESLTSSLGQMATGMSTALTTTLIGLTSSLHLKCQLMLLESHNVKK